jgi:hypothetical protein
MGIADEKWELYMVAEAQGVRDETGKHLMSEGVQRLMAIYAWDNN